MRLKPEVTETVAETLLLRDDEGVGEEERLPLGDGELLRVRDGLGDVEALTLGEAATLLEADDVTLVEGVNELERGVGDIVAKTLLLRVTERDGEAERV